MLSQKLILSILFLLLMPIVPTASHALDVTVGTTVLTTTETINSRKSIRLVNANGTPRTYTGTAGGTFTISTLSGSGFPARVFVENGATVDRQVLTDAVVLAAAGNTNPSTLTIAINSSASAGDYTTVAAGLYPYAVAMNGNFVATTVTAARTNTILVTGSGNGNTIDNPSSTSPSLVAPPFTTAASASFSRQESESISCPGFESSGPCSPFLDNTITLTLRPAHSVRLPGSIDLVKVNVDVENGGNAILADVLAGLTKGHKIYQVRLEPSPGQCDTPIAGVCTDPDPNRLIIIRNISNSQGPWVTARGGDGDDDGDDDNHGNGNTVSQTKVEIESNGTGEVTAKGLCPASGCPPSNEVGVVAFCGADVVFESSLSLNKKGDGKADLFTGTSCPDPAVLLTDNPDNPEFGEWIAAPLVQ